MPRDKVGQWMKRARLGQTNALGRIYEYLRKHLLPYIKRSAPSHLDAEDVLDDTFVLLWAGLERLRDDVSLLGYAAKIADRIMARKKRSFFPVAICARLKVVRCDPSEGNLEGQEFLTALLDTLTQAEFQLFELLFVQGASTREIRLSLRLRSNALDARKYRLVRKLRRIVRELHE